MNSTGLKGNWKEKKARLKQKDAVLTDNDLLREEVKSEELYRRLHKIPGKTKAEIHKIIEAL